MQKRSRGERSNSRRTEHGIPPPPRRRGKAEKTKIDRIPPKKSAMGRAMMVADRSGNYRKSRYRFSASLLSCPRCGGPRTSGEVSRNKLPETLWMTSRFNPTRVKGREKKMKLARITRQRIRAFGRPTPAGRWMMGNNAKPVSYNLQLETRSRQSRLDPTESAIAAICTLDN